MARRNSSQSGCSPEAARYSSTRASVVASFGSRAGSESDTAAVHDHIGPEVLPGDVQRGARVTAEVLRLGPRLGDRDADGVVVTHDVEDVGQLGRTVLASGHEHTDAMVVGQRPARQGRRQPRPHRSGRSEQERPGATDTCVDHCRLSGGGHELGRLGPRAVEPHPDEDWRRGWWWAGGGVGRVTGRQ